MKKLFLNILLPIAAVILVFPVFGQIGTRFPSERKVINDPVTGHKLIFLTSTPEPE